MVQKLITNLLWWLFDSTGQGFNVKSGQGGNQWNQQVTGQRAARPINTNASDDQDSTEAHKMNYNVQYLHFNNAQALIKYIENTPVSDLFEGREERGYSPTFAGVSTFEEAKKLILEGWSEMTSLLETGIKDNVKVHKKDAYKANLPKSNLEGYTPIVAKALLGLPDSMVCSKPHSRNVKCLYIKYVVSVNCIVSMTNVVKSGIALLSALKILNLQRHNIKIDVIFKCSYEDNEAVSFSLRVKDYSEPFNLMRLSFPLAHPAMLRVFGFRCLERIPGLHRLGWTHGYGHSFSILKEIEEISKSKNEIVLNVYQIMDLHYDVNAIIQYIKEQCSRKD